MLRGLIALFAALLSAAYFLAAYGAHAANASFASQPRAEASATLEHVADADSALRGSRWMLPGLYGRQVTLSFHSRAFGLVVAKTTVPSSVAESLSRSRAVDVEYVAGNPLDFRIKAVADDPVAPMLIGAGLLAFAAFMAWQAVRERRH